MNNDQDLMKALEKFPRFPGKQGMNNTKCVNILEFMYQDRVVKNVSELTLELVFDRRCCGETCGRFIIKWRDSVLSGLPMDQPLCRKSLT